ncbi:MAG: hypothetical protein LH478_12215 [Chitinophagaceae bacterium]|nr:hypothetical protein [Chitinophagaceae bacterium]
MASLLQRDSPDFIGTMFPKLLRMFWNAYATLGTQPADVPYAITGIKQRVLVLVFNKLGE